MLGDIKPAQLDQHPDVHLLQFDAKPTLDLVTSALREEGTEPPGTSLFKTTGVVTLLEPVTATAILVIILAEIGKGALQWVGGRIMQSLFGGGELDVEALFWRLLQEFQQVVRIELRAEALRHDVTSLQGVQLIMQEYARAPQSPQRQATLPLAAVQLSMLNKDLEDLGLPAGGTVGLSATLRLALNAEFYFVAGRIKGDLDNCKDVLAEFQAHVEKLHDALVKATVARFGPVTSLSLSFPNTPTSFPLWLYRFDGAFVHTSRPSDRRAVVEARAQHIERETVSQVTKIIVPLQAVAAQMQDVITKLPAPHH